jgi:serine/threonine-protein kinase ULK/ATG1/polo-like kinase 4
MFLKQILNGFQGLHNLGVMHRDFKLANVLLNDEVCKIADLGFAKKMERN